MTHEADVIGDRAHFAQLDNAFRCLDRVFIDFDTAARKAYEDRAQHATGIVEHHG